MAIRDARLLFSAAAGSLPETLLGNNTVHEPAPFPDGFTNVNALDLGAIQQDFGLGRTLKARFTITEGFTNADTGWRCLFGIMVARDAGLTYGAQVIAQVGPSSGSTATGFTSSQLVTANQVIEIPVPQLPSIARASEDGFRYLGLFMSILQIASAPSTGLVRAELVMDSDPEQFASYRPTDVVSLGGFVVQ